MAEHDASSDLGPVPADKELGIQTGVKHALKKMPRSGYYLTQSCRKTSLLRLVVLAIVDPTSAALTSVKGFRIASASTWLYLTNAEAVTNKRSSTHSYQSAQPVLTLRPKHASHTPLRSTKQLWTNNVQATRQATKNLTDTGVKSFVVLHKPASNTPIRICR
uniref:Uncharacterized protein n=1 Tax=Rhodosorus marinus TaxID=101924 RepID=A0A7S3A283_9RHOD